eukprot:scaffold309888_cov18-Tisochrysis_lutea.AAC.2
MRKVSPTTSHACPRMVLILSLTLNTSLLARLFLHHLVTPIACPPMPTHACWHSLVGSWQAVSSYCTAWVSQASASCGQPQSFPNSPPCCRFAIWPRVREFIDQIAPGAVVADVGCGNGKYFGVRRDIAVLGSDRSAGWGCKVSRVGVLWCRRVRFQGLCTPRRGIVGLRGKQEASIACTSTAAMLQALLQAWWGLCCWLDEGLVKAPLTKLHAPDFGDSKHQMLGDCLPGRALAFKTWCHWLLVPWHGSI